jgi:mycothiol synthase
MKANLQEKVEVSPPEGFTVRGAVMEDVKPALEMFNRWSRSVIGEDEITDAAAIRTEWVSPGFDPSQDIRLIFAPDGEMAGYVEVWTTGKPPVHPWIWGRVDPRYAGYGLGTYLTMWAETRALDALERVPDGLRFAPHVGTYREADAARALFEELGYHLVRSSYTMRIDLEDEAPAAPQWPEGIVLRPFDLERDLAPVYRAVDEAFSDHYGHVETPFEEGLERFRHFMTGNESFDPALWFIAVDGEEIAGMSLCRERAYDDPQVGWVNTLGVRRPWRKRGLGHALLRHSFGELYRRGKRKVGLGVDAENLTGALRLYENAGMRIYRAFDRFEKELRPGREISVQSL